MAPGKKYRYLQIRNPEAIRLVSERAKKELRSLGSAGAISLIEHLSSESKCKKNTGLSEIGQGKNTLIVPDGEGKNKQMDNIS